MLRTHLIHARDIIRDLGLRRGLGMGPRWLQARRFHLVASPIDATLDVAPLAGARCEVLTERDLWAFVRGCQAVSAREVRRRWRARAECLVCWIDGEVAAYRWDATGTAYLPYLSRWLRGAPGDGLVLECRTLPGRRRRGAGSLLVRGPVRARPSAGDPAACRAHRRVEPAEPGLGRWPGMVATGRDRLPLDPSGSALLRRGGPAPRRRRGGRPSSGARRIAPPRVRPRAPGAAGRQRSSGLAATRAANPPATNFAARLPGFRAACSRKHATNSSASLARG